jgi:hypothetical protein
MDRVIALSVTPRAPTAAPSLCRTVPTSSPIAPMDALRLDRAFARIIGFGSIPIHRVFEGG